MKYLQRLPHLTTYQIIASTFLGLILCGTLLLMLPLATVSGTSMPWVDALFTATSAACVTGLAVVDTGRYFSLFGQLVIIMLIQLGGLGIMTFATLFSVAFGRKINLQDRLRIQESLNNTEMAGVVKLCQQVVKYTLVIEAFFGTVLAIRFYQDFGLRGIYYGYWHAVSGFCNAGFDLMGNGLSLKNYVGDWTVNISIMALIILGGIGFAVMHDCLQQHRFAKLRLHTKVVLITTAFLIIGGALMIGMTESGNARTLGSMSWDERVLSSLFQSVTTRTAGFYTVDLPSLSDASILGMIALMFIGASPASTGGGMKTTTFAVIMLMVWSFIKGKKESVIFGRRIEPEAVNRSFAIFTVGILWVSLATYAVCHFEGGFNRDFLPIFFEVVSAFATVGLSLNDTGNLTSASKLVLVLTMYAGRVGILSFVLALTSKTQPNAVRYPTEKIMIG